jgi:ribosome recycling factor
MLSRFAVRSAVLASRSSSSVATRRVVAAVCARSEWTPTPLAARHYPTRGMAKKSKKEKKGKGGGGSSSASSAAASAPSSSGGKDGGGGGVDFDIGAHEAKMQPAIDRLKEKLSQLRVGRPSPGALADVMVKAYGSLVELKTLGSVSVHSTHSLGVMVHDPSLLSAVQEALAASPLVGDDGGVSAANSGLVVKFAPPTADARKQMAKLVSARGEDAKVAARKVRNGAVDALKK